MSLKELLLMVDYHFHVGGCLYAPVLIHRNRDEFMKTLSLPPEFEQCREALRSRITEKIIEALMSSNFVDSVSTIDLSNINLNVVDCRFFWLTTLGHYWDKVGKIKFILPGDVYVIASTMIYPKQKPGFKDIIKEICADNHLTYYLCVECLLYGKKCDKFLFEAESIQTHRLHSHCFLTLSDMFEGSHMQHSFSQEFKVNGLQLCGQLSEKLGDRPTNPWFLMQPLQTFAKFNATLTIRPFNGIKLHHAFVASPRPLQRKTPESVQMMQQQVSVEKQFQYQPIASTSQMETVSSQYIGSQNVCIMEYERYKGICGRSEGYVPPNVQGERQRGYGSVITHHWNHVQKPGVTGASSQPKVNFSSALVHLLSVPSLNTVTSSQPIQGIESASYNPVNGPVAKSCTNSSTANYGVPRIGMPTYLCYPNTNQIVFPGSTSHINVQNQLFTPVQPIAQANCNVTSTTLPKKDPYKRKFSGLSDVESLIKVTCNQVKKMYSPTESPQSSLNEPKNSTDDIRTKDSSCKGTAEDTAVSKSNEIATTHSQVNNTQITSSENNNTQVIVISNTSQHINTQIITVPNLSGDANAQIIAPLNTNECNILGITQVESNCSEESDTENQNASESYDKLRTKLNIKVSTLTVSIPAVKFSMSSKIANPYFFKWALMRLIKMKESKVEATPAVVTKLIFNVDSKEGEVYRSVLDGVLLKQVVENLLGYIHPIYYEFPSKYQLQNRIKTRVGIVVEGSE